MTDRARDLVDELVSAGSVRLADRDKVESAMRRVVDLVTADVLNDRVKPVAEIRSPILRSHSRPQRPKTRS